MKNDQVVVFGIFTGLLATIAFYLFVSWIVTLPMWFEYVLLIVVGPICVIIGIGVARIVMRPPSNK